MPKAARCRRHGCWRGAGFLQIGKDRAVRPIISGAAPNKCFQRLCHLLKAGDPDWDVFSLARKGRNEEEAAAAKKKLGETLTGMGLANMICA